ncbi:MAG: hypothetical protein FD126_3612, partial [Elusimicrobia bacterium]
WAALARDWASRADLPRRAFLGGLLAAAGVLLAQNLASPDIRFGVSSFLVFWSLGLAAGLGWGADVPVLPFPGRFALSGAGLLALALWGRSAVDPLLAQRRLSAQPSFHVEGGGDFDRAVAELEGRLKESPRDVDLAAPAAPGRSTTSATSPTRPATAPRPSNGGSARLRPAPSRSTRASTWARPSTRWDASRNPPTTWSRS